MKKTKTTETAAVPAAQSHPFADARRASVPLVMYETSDPAATVRMCEAALNGQGILTPLVQWDCSRVLTAGNKAGADLIESLDLADPTMIQNPSEFLAWLAKPDNSKKFKREKADGTTPAKPGAIIFMHNAHRMLTDTVVMQATWNLRDVFKAQQTTLVMLVIPGSKPPMELQNDVITLNDPKPGPVEAAAIIKRMAEAAQAGGAEIDPEAVSTDERTIDRALGTSGFGVEQVVAMSIRKTGLDVDTLSRRQRKMIEQTPGLAVITSAERLEDIAGHKNVIEFLRGILTSGRTRVNSILFLDEIDKSLGAGGGDTSGTSQDQAGVFLKVTQDNNWPAIMLIGPGGTGKSLIAKAAGTIAGCLTMSGDLGACKGSLVGESEAKVRGMFETAGAVSQNKVLIIATCNRIGALTPEIRRRFKLGTFFVDLLDSDERAACWKLKRAKFKIEADDKEPTNCDGWTGAEIEAACEIAYRRSCSLIEAARYIVPVCVSAADEITTLRKGANNRFISAAQPGLYKFRKVAAMDTTTPSREFNL